MSLQIIKAGLLDTVQDSGRHGYQHLGINPTGTMDRFSARVANALLGKSLNAPVIEMHFPAPIIQFQKDTILCLTGADFSPAIDDVVIPLHQPVIVHKNSLLTFKKWVQGARCYLSILQNLEIEPWLNSYSTNIKAAAGGWQGRRLQKGDIINYKQEADVTMLSKTHTRLLPWKAEATKPATGVIECLYGAEWNWMEEEAKRTFQKDAFYISHTADRMGYRLNGKALKTHMSPSLLSSGVNFGTVQLLPDGQLVILMADHQTTGGYPKIAHVISAHLPQLAQMNPGQALKFQIIELELAEQQAADEHNYLQHLQNACKLKLQNLL